MGKIYYNGVDYSTPVVSGVSGIKGNAETTYRTGNVNITPANIGLGNVNNTADSAKSVKYAATAGSATPVAHASTATTYGKSTGSNYGHTKLSDTYTSSVGDASSGVAASQKALFDAYSTLNSNIANSDIEGIFNYLGLELIIYHKLGICYLHSSGRLTQAFPKEWTTIGEISNINYKGYGHLAANTSGKIIKFAYINGTLSAYAPSSTNAIEYVQDSCVLI